MFPAADEILTFTQIADYWASEVVPAEKALRERRELQILDLLVAAWWLGEIVCQSHWRRLDELRSLFNWFGDDICFELDDGSFPPTKIERPRFPSGTRLFIRVP